MEFKEINGKDTYDLLLTVHYAKRIPSISYAYGAYEDNCLVGCVTFGKPASPSLCKGICGEQFKDKVYELNRLVIISEEKNLPSQLIGYALRQLKKKDLILVSFADLNMNHHGYVYQATNWLYTGLSAKHTDIYVTQGKHNRHYDTNELTKHLRVLRSRKYRYVYFATNKRNKKIYLDHLNYPIIKPYPKGDNTTYDTTKSYNGRWIRNNVTGKEFYENDGDNSTIENNRVIYAFVNNHNQLVITEDCISPLWTLDLNLPGVNKENLDLYCVIKILYYLTTITDVNYCGVCFYTNNQSLKNELVDKLTIEELFLNENTYLKIESINKSEFKKLTKEFKQASHSMSNNPNQKENNGITK